MTEPSWFSSEVSLAAAVPRWAWTFYRRHLRLVVGLSLIPAAERVVVVLWGRQLPTPLPALLELVAELARLILLYQIARRAILRDDELRPFGRVESARRLGRFARAHWPSLVVQLAMLAAAGVLFKVIPDGVAGDDPRKVALLLALKNPTVIAFTIIWWVGIIRQAVKLSGPTTQPAARPFPGS
jgi:hypothetical protein